MDKNSKRKFSMRLKKKKKTVQVSLVGRINKRIQAKCNTFGVMVMMFKRCPMLSSPAKAKGSSLAGFHNVVNNYSVPLIVRIIS